MISKMKKTIVAATVVAAVAAAVAAAAVAEQCCQLSAPLLPSSCLWFLWLC